MDLSQFPDLKRDERYKRLEHNLKLGFIRKMERQMKARNEKCTLPTWPSLSSINPNGTDVSRVIGPSSLHLSYGESEVVSSSKNLRNVLMIHQNGRTHSQLPISTSSVKKFPIDKSEKEGIIMPSLRTTAFHNLKRISNQILQNEQGSSEELEENVHDSIKQLPNTLSYQGSNIFQNEPRDIIKPRVFSRWKVLLNDQDHLIIKGILECGTIARSKPITQRLTNTNVLSIYKHIYELHGNIVDDRNELPNYVRGKFHNGFPDDWKNVYHIWRKYRAEGCPITFRWPTPVADSDDDLHSEVTDFSYIKNKELVNENQEKLSKSISHNRLSLEYRSKLQTDINENSNKLNEDRVKATKSINQILNKISDSEHSFNIIDTSQCNHERNNQNFSQDAHNSGLNGCILNQKNIKFLYNVIQEDKVHIILSKLRDYNCSAQYIDKFIDLIDCLKYLILYNPITSNEIECHEQNLLISKVQNKICTKCNSTALFSDTREINQESQLNVLNNNTNRVTSEKIHKNIKNPEYSKSTETASKKESNKRKFLDADNLNKSSDSDDYMGFPNVSLSHLIKAKKTNSERYRDRKNRKNDRRNIDKNIQAEEEVQPPSNNKTEHYYESSINLSEEDNEQQMLQQKVAISPSRNSGNVVDNEYNKDNFKIPSTTNIISQKSVKKHKPFVKSNESVNFDMTLRPRCSKNDKTLENSGISIVESDNSFRESISSKYYQPSVIIEKMNIQDLDKELKSHLFLTYDSEDFFNDKEAFAQNQLSNNYDKIGGKSSEIAENNNVDKRTLINTSVVKEKIEEKSSTGKRKRPSNTKSTKKNLFGSKENPKVLASWIPRVVYNDKFKKKCNLIFEGKLLNEAGHVLNRKFVMDPVRQRHSATLIETVKGEYYKLSGEINDTKHVLPKELLKQCRTGCPTKIKKFCEEWGRRRSDSLTTPTSSRGRRIVPALKYWTGERVVMRGNDSIYTPGHEWDTSSSHIANKSQTFKKPMPASERLPENSIKEAVTKVSKNLTKTSKMENLPSQKSRDQLANKCVAQTYLSNSELDNKESTIKKTSRRSEQKTSSNPAELTPNSVPLQSKVAILTESAYNTKLQKKRRLEAEVKQNPETEINKRFQVARKKHKPAIEWTYEKEQRKYDILSEDQLSIC